MLHSVLLIIKSSFIAISGIVFFSLVGFILGKAKLIEETAGKIIGKLIYYFMLPSLLLYNIATNFDLHNFYNYWPIPVFVVINLIVGISLGFLMQLLVKADDKLKKVSTVCISMPNVTSFPLAIASVLFFQGGPLANYQNAANSMGYLSFYVVVFAFFKWTFVRRYMCVGVEKVQVSSEEEIPLTSKQPIDRESLELAPKKNFFRSLWEGFKKLFINPPVIFSVIGMAIGLIEPLRDYIFKMPNNPNPPLAFIGNLIKDGSAGTVPIFLITAGMSLTAINMFNQSFMEKKVIISIVLAKLVLFPLCMMFIIFGASKLDLLPDDPVLICVLLIVTITPTSIDVYLISQMEDVCTNEVSITMFWMYMACIVTMPAWLITQILFLESKWWFNIL